MMVVDRQLPPLKQDMAHQTHTPQTQNPADMAHQILMDRTLTKSLMLLAWVTMTAP